MTGRKRKEHEERIFNQNGEKRKTFYSIKLSRNSLQIYKHKLRKSKNRFDDLVESNNYEGKLVLVEREVSEYKLIE